MPSKVKNIKKNNIWDKYTNTALDKFGKTKPTMAQTGIINVLWRAIKLRSMAFPNKKFFFDTYVEPRWDYLIFNNLREYENTEVSHMSATSMQDRRIFRVSVTYLVSVLPQNLEYSGTYIVSKAFA